MSPPPARPAELSDLIAWARRNTGTARQAAAAARQAAAAARLAAITAPEEQP